MNKRVSKGEGDFIRGCTKAILENKVDQIHWLILKDGVRHYIAYHNETEIENFIHGNHLKLICVVNKEFISDWHIRYSGNDLSKGLIKKRLGGMIRASEKVADLAYGDHKKEDIEKLLNKVPTEGLTSDERKRYLDRVKELLDSK
ncbi:hypothetical protein ACQCVB_19570 [Fictibacillus phosphorivorans]|uniref:hypothetical protein n=1 Tax=Fictibacillus phosphorivorans TaxID=1221500 RepID=UPI003CF5E59B